MPPSAPEREGEGPLGEFFDTIDPDSTFGQKSWERAESRLHHDTVELAVKKAGLSYADLDCLPAGTCSTSASVPPLEYGSWESPIWASTAPAPIWQRDCCSPPSWRNRDCGTWGYPRRPISVRRSGSTGSRWRYGGQRTPTSQWTVTGGGAVVVAGAAAQTPDQAGPWIQAAAIGTIEDKGIKDAANMGAAMAPAAAATILGFLSTRHHSRGL